MSEAVETIPQVVFKLDGITFLPCYDNSGMFVSPGFGRHHGNKFTPDELMQMGATSAKHPLWGRGL